MGRKAIEGWGGGLERYRIEEKGGRGSGRRRGEEEGERVVIMVAQFLLMIQKPGPGATSIETSASGLLSPSRPAYPLTSYLSPPQRPPYSSYVLLPSPTLDKNPSPVLFPRFSSSYLPSFNPPSPPFLLPP